MFNFRNIIIFCLFALLGNMLGCGGDKRPDGMPKIFPCTLTLTQGGKPLPGAMVLLYSKGEPCPWTVGGTTDDNGEAVLKTHGKFNGAPKGEWTVVVTKNIIIYKNESDDIGDVYSNVELDYTDKETTPLELKIDGKTKQSFDVGSEVQILLSDD